MIHVVPLNDEREHVLESSCWCEPRMDWTDPETGDFWPSGDARAIHNAADCRECVEEVTGESVEKGKEWVIMNSDGEILDAAP